MRGTRQGGSLSGALWCRYQSQVNLAVRDAVHRLGIGLKLRLPNSRTLVKDAVLDSTLSMPPTVYMDDVSCILTAVSDTLLLRGIAQLTPLVHEQYAKVALTLNYKPNKTCVMVHLAGKQKASLKQMLAQVAHNNGLEGCWLKDCSGRMIQVAPNYELLGRVVSECGKVEQEVSKRIAKSHDAFKQHLPVLRSPGLSRKSRLTFLSQYVLCHVTQGLAVLPLLC
eukprot:4773878-Amphidinium_carterae.1